MLFHQIINIVFQLMFLFLCQEFGILTDCLLFFFSQLINEFCYIYIFGNDDILNTCNGLLVRSIIVPVFYRKIPAGSGKYLFRDICAVRQGNGIYDRVFREMNVKECPLFRGIPPLRHCLMAGFYCRIMVVSFYYTIF